MYYGRSEKIPCPLEQLHEFLPLQKSVGCFPLMLRRRNYSNKICHTVLHTLATIISSLKADEVTRNSPYEQMYALLSLTLEYVQNNIPNSDDFYNILKFFGTSTDSDVKKIARELWGKTFFF